MPNNVAGFGFSTSQHRDTGGLDGDLARIAELGAGFAELSLCAMDLVVAGRPYAPRLRELERVCAKHRLRYTAHGPLAVNFMDPRHDALFRRVVPAYLDICHAVGATVLVLHTGVVQRRPQPELDHLHAREREALRQLGDVAAKAGVKLALETLYPTGPDSYTANPARLAAEIEAVDHPNVVGCLDLSHAYLNCTFNGLDFEAEVERFATVAGHLHMHDSFGLPATVRGFSGAEDVAFGLGDLHLPLGYGDIPFERLLPRLAVKPETVLLCELPPHFHVDGAHCAERLRSWAPLVGQAAAG
ncbi:MAG: sugar phosphate isomerase/epimerase [Geminicoccaceae bacterium]|nr:MAG: sugar phosphate isomerase/epimerase [Geminicoccaceae bacterium]